MFVGMRHSALAPPLQRPLSPVGLQAGAAPGFGWRTGHFGGVVLADGVPALEEHLYRLRRVGMIRHPAVPVVVREPRAILAQDPPKARAVRLLVDRAGVEKDLMGLPFAWLDRRSPLSIVERGQVLCELLRLLKVAVHQSPAVVVEQVVGHRIPRARLSASDGAVGGCAACGRARATGSAATACAPTTPPRPKPPPRSGR